MVRQKVCTLNIQIHKCTINFYILKCDVPNIENDLFTKFFLYFLNVVQWVFDVNFDDFDEIRF